MGKVFAGPLNFWLVPLLTRRAFRGRERFTGYPGSDKQLSHAPQFRAIHPSFDRIRHTQALTMPEPH